MDFPRDKGILHAAIFRLLYLTKTLVTKIFGKRLTLGFLLDISWLFRRLAFELGGEMYGNHSHNESLATSPSVLKEIIPKGSRVVDIGCRSGRWARVTSELGCEVVGVDHSASNLESARSKGGNIEYIQFDATQDFGKLGKFDFGVLTHVLEHIENPIDLMRSLRSSCKKLVIEVPDFESDSLNWLRIKTNRPYYSDADHVREYSSESIKELVNKTGWVTTYKFQKGGAQ